MSLGAFLVDQSSRDMVVRLYPPKFPELIGHHVSHQFVRDANVDREIAPSPTTVSIIGYACNDGLEAFAVAVDGNTLRPDGKTYHLTWSLDRSKGYKPVDSNELVLKGRIQPISPPIPLRTVFAYL